MFANNGCSRKEGKLFDTNFLNHVFFTILMKNECTFDHEEDD